MQTVTITFNIPDNKDLELLLTIAERFGVTVVEKEVHTMDETEYLKSSQVNHQKLMQRIQNVNQKNSLVTISSDDVVKMVNKSP
ncbi:MAG: hypothetical protein H7A23_21835 [Leptospiraceae bacterium]|nr:hypothetical protein [Leptospiraceae bacterium]